MCIFNTKPQTIPRKSRERFLAMLLEYEEKYPKYAITIPEKTYIHSISDRDRREFEKHFNTYTKNGLRKIYRG